MILMIYIKMRITPPITGGVLLLIDNILLLILLFRIVYSWTIHRQYYHKDPLLYIDKDYAYNHYYLYKVLYNR